MEHIRPDDEDLRTAAKSKPESEPGNKRPDKRVRQPKPAATGRAGKILLVLALVALFPQLWDFIVEWIRMNL